MRVARLGERLGDALCVFPLSRRQLRLGLHPKGARDELLLVLRTPKSKTERRRPPQPGTWTAQRHVAEVRLVCRSGATRRGEPAAGSLCAR